MASVPPETPEHEVLSALKTWRWIYQQLRDFRGATDTHCSASVCVSGESHYYLGKQYQLKVTEDATAAATSENVAWASGSDCQVTNRQKRLKPCWLNGIGNVPEMYFNGRLDLLIPQTLWVSERPPIRLRAMQTQWQLFSKGCLTLNPWLVKASSECIDYVLHELCHVAEHNHSEEFYRLMGQVMPGWEKVKKRLDGMAGMLLADM